MKKPEAYLKEIEKLRLKHSANAETNNHHLNDNVRSKIITAWEGYHSAISKLLDAAGLVSGNEHCDYSTASRIESLVSQRDYFMKETDKARALLAKHGL